MLNLSIPRHQLIHKIKDNSANNFKLNLLWFSMWKIILSFVVVDSLSHVWLFVTVWTTTCQALLSFTISQSFLKPMSIELVVLSNHPLSSPSPPVFNLSQKQGLFQWVNSSHQVAKVLEFQLKHHSFQRTPRTDLL